MNVWYPLRTFNLVALYNLQDTLLDGSAKLHWNVKEENKTAELRGRWENPPVPEGNLHHVDLSLAHPSFRKVCCVFVNLNYCNFINFNLCNLIFLLDNFFAMLCI